ncbi:MAG TPA: tryptophan synthase subunit alpha [Candidatus Saccharimonadales bacterium]|nr:tryptophan synthase subunit alpha [Candidatus Saccharimonadales bacterium]
MNILDQKLTEITQRKRVGLMTHVVVGYPTVADTISIVKTMAAHGADIIELQIPFSDPLADGPTIMRACEASLRSGTKVADAFAIMQVLSKEVSVPLLFMAYYNTVFTYGVESFCRDAQQAGASGLIVPDMPIEEENHEHYLKYCRKYNLHNIQVISPASTEDRLQKNAKVANGFVYCTARQGITGVQKNLDSGLTAYLRKAQEVFSIPIAVGFGISKKEHIKAVSGHADIAVVGSAIIDVINTSSKQDMTKHISEFLQNMVE